MNSKVKDINILSGKNSMEYSLLTILRKKYYKEDTLILMDPRVEDIEVLEDSKPFFSPKYLLVLYLNQMKIEEIKKIVKITNSLEFWDKIFINESKKSYDYLEELLNNNKTVNLYRPPEWLISEYVKMNIKYKFTIPGYEAFLKRMKYQWRYIDDYIIQFNDVKFTQDEKDEGEGRETVQLLTPKIVNKIIPPYDNLNFSRMLEDILLGKSMRKYMKKLEGYKYAHKYTYKTLVTKLDLLITIKQDYCLGNLTLRNIVDYCKQNNIMYYECREIVNSTMHIATLEKLYKIKHKLVTFEGKKNPLIEFFLETELI